MIKCTLHGNMLTPALHWNNYNTTWWCVLQYIKKYMNKKLTITCT